MQSIAEPSKGGNGGGYYFQYYTRHSQQPGVWLGDGPAALGLPRDVRREHFDNLANGFSPDGTLKLVQNAGSEKRQGFWDRTFSVPKSLSGLYAAAPSIRGEIEEAGWAALYATLKRSDDVAGLSRKGKAGIERVPAALSHAVFFHVSSRAEDPQLHWHCLLMNVGVRDDGTTGALYSKRIYETKVEAGIFFQEQLAAELRKRLGLKIVKEKVGWHIEGVPKELCDFFSKRREEITRFLKRHGQVGGKAAKLAAILTRGKKRFTKLEELSKIWEAAAAAHGFGPEEVRLLLDKGHKQNQRESEKQQGFDQQDSKQQGFKQSRTSGKKPGPEERSEPKNSKKLFERELQDTVDRTFPENQFRPRILRIANAIARKHGFGEAEALQAVDKLKLPIHRRFYRIEWRPVFSKSPIRGLKRLRLRKIVIRNRARRWGKIRERKPLLHSLTGNLTLRVQERRLFPNAPKWNPVSKLFVPALRIRKEKVPPPVHAQEHQQRKHLSH